MFLQLKDIASVAPGVRFQSRPKVDRNISVKVIQMKDLGADNVVRLDGCMRIEHPQLQPHQLARLGDIIFRSRGPSNTAALINQETMGTIVAAPLMRVRLRSNKVKPEFLLWWINHSQAQAYLAAKAKGTTIKAVSRQDLEELEVELPSLEQQAQIADLFIKDVRNSPR